MENKNNNSLAIEAVKNIVNETPLAEREQLRDELLAFLLFEVKEAPFATPQNVNEQMKGISDKERALIKKLARQTEALYKIMQEQNQSKSDQ